MADSYHWFLTITKSIVLYGLCLSVAFELQPISIIVAQGQLQITQVDLSQFPQVQITIQHSGLRSDEIKIVQIREDNELQNAQVKLLEKIRVGILADIYLGLKADIASEFANAVDELDNQPWQWEQMERALFVPIGEEGHEITANPDWTNKSWRIISNEIAAYYTAQDEAFKPKASKTALLDLVLETLNHYDQASMVDNYLLVLTDGFDATCIDAYNYSKLNQTCIAKIEEIVALAAQKNVQIYLADYNGLTRGSPGYVLPKLAASLSTEIFSLPENKTLAPLWQRIAQQPISSQIVYHTQHLPPFSIVAQIKAIQSASVAVQTEIPVVAATIVEPQSDTIINRRSSQVILALNWGEYPPRDIAQITYRIAGGPPTPATSWRVSDNNQLSFTVNDIPEGQPLLDIVVYEKLDNRATVVQTRLTTSFSPTSTPIPTRTLAPTPTPAPTSTTIWDQAAILIVTPIVTRIPENIRTNRNITQALPAIFPLLLLVALWFALVAWRRANRRVGPVEGNLNLPHDRTTQNTTEVPLDSRPIAQLILIQGERSLPAIIPLYEGRTKFGRDPSWADEVLANRFVSLLQFAITIDANYHNLGNFSERNPTIVDGSPAKKGAEGDLEQGSPLKSGSIIQFGPFKYKFQFNTQFGATEHYRNGQTTTASPNGSSNV